jgi:hypothetical protein
MVLRGGFGGGAAIVVVVEAVVRVGWGWCE